MKVCVIPARGGSKRIPRKNVKEFRGKPMIQWSIEAAQKANCFDRIILSSDDEEIGKFATRLGVEVPFVRPAHLSDDHATTVDVVKHAISELGDQVEQVCCLYATAPFVDCDDMRVGMQKLEKAPYAIPVTSFAYPIQRAVFLPRDGGIQMFDSKQYVVRSQDLTEAYHDVGQFYCGTVQAWLNDVPIFGPETVPIIIPRSRAQDIDTPEDWEHAENMHKVLFG